ncbi:MAG TPA: OmpA family protein [Candidatus Tectomicrobia bacterium]
MSRTKGERVLRGIAMGLVGLVGALGVGCSTAREPLALEHARLAYIQAQQDPQLTSQAPVALQEAEQTLSHAERIWKDDQNVEEVQHLAQLTEQRLEIARAVAQHRMAEADIQRLGKERERVLQEARTREARRAQEEAERAQQEATLAQQAAQTAAARATQLEQELAALKAKETERGLVLTLGDVLFEFNRADLKPGTMQKLYPLVTFLQENPTRNVVIEGHTDNIGSDAYNQELSQQRADAVRGFLIQNGIGAERITAQGRGKSYPVASNDTEVGRQQNRRVEITIPR